MYQQEGLIKIMGIGDWGLGIGDWGLGIGDWGLGTLRQAQCIAGDWGEITPNS
ncbi:MAG: hypothetical protein ACSI46_26220 [Gloeotrichia echinulata DVL01]